MKDVDNPVSVKNKLPKETDETLLTIFNLCKDMDVDLEYIKGYYCCMLYALDYHSEGEKVNILRKSWLKFNIKYIIMWLIGSWHN